VRGDEVTAIDRTINCDFALGAAAHGADFFSFGGTKSLGFSFVANWAEHILRDS
jgi:hypothetical protein